MKNKKILLIGGFPPPYGGILVHIKRIYDNLKEKGYECNVLDLPYITGKKSNLPDIISPYNFIKLLNTRNNFSVVHIHVTALGNYFFIYLLSIFYKNSNLLITIHSGSFSEKFLSIPKFKRFIISKIFKNVNKIILVSDAQKSVFKLHFKQYFSKTSVISAYIHPTIMINKHSRSLLLEKRKIFNKILLTSGGYFDYYGYDMLINFLKDNQNIFCIFSLYGNGITEYRERIINEIELLENAILFDGLNPEEFNWLLKNVDYFIRNTDRDGDSVAIRESAHWGTKVIASNAVKRPEGTLLFSFNKLDEFQKCFNKVCDEPKLGIVKDVPDYLNELVTEYKL